MSSTFADRLWWARNRKGWGATILSREVECAQSLISTIERNNQDRSSLNNKFAKALDVDPHWLATGLGRAPEGFDEKDAREGRESPKRQGQRSRIIPLRTPEPRWADSTGGDVAAPLRQIGQEANLQKAIMSDFIDYARLVGPERTKAFIELLTHYAEVLLPIQRAEGQHNVGSANKANNRT
jgi:hypothetical protein